MGKRKTEKDYKKLASKNSLKFLGPMPKGVNIKTRWLCRNGHTWETTYDSINQGSSCLECSYETRGNSRRKTKRDYQSAARKIDILFIGKVPKYTKDKTEWKCKKGHKWESTYDNVSHGHGCLICNNQISNTRLSESDYKKKASELSILWIGPKVKNAHTKTGWKCTNGHTWKATYSNISSGKLCPECNMSSGEQIIANILNNKNVRYEAQKTFPTCKNKNLLRFDFYIKSKNLLIEFHGAQHYKSVSFFGGLKQQKHRDKIKSDWASNNGLILVIIPYTEKDNIESILSRYI